jgi:hypothetical protein
MTEIKEFVTRGVTALPPYRNLVPRFMKEGGAQENDEGCIDRGDQRILDSWEEDFHGLRCRFSFRYIHPRLWSAILEVKYLFNQDAS